MKFFYFILFVFQLGCCQKENHQIGIEYIKNYREKGGKFYYNIDFLLLEGKNEFKDTVLKKNGKLFGIFQNSEGNIFIDEINVSNDSFNYKTLVFNKFADSYLSTVIYKELDKDIFSRKITRIFDSRKVEYNYSIINNFEYLTEIIITSKNNEIKHYINSSNTYYDFLLINDFDSIPNSFELQ